MADELRPDDLCRLWQDQPVENAAMSLEEIRDKAQKFRARIRRRNLREYLAAVVVVIAFAYYIYKFTDPLIRIGSGLVIAGAMWTMYQLHRRTAPRSLPAGLALVGSLEFYRQELIRQRDALHSVWVWYILPMTPGLVVFIAGTRPTRALMVAPFVGTLTAVSLGIWWMNRKAAVRLNRQIAELDSLEDQS
jgi:Flp pilus assembly protein TadB